jgi:hypothetical protein
LRRKQIEIEEGKVPGPIIYPSDHRGKNISHIVRAKKRVKRKGK